MGVVAMHQSKTQFGLPRTRSVELSVERTEVGKAEGAEPGAGAPDREDAIKKQLLALLVDNVPSGGVGSAPPACPAVVPAAGAPASVHVVRAGVDHARPVPAADAAVPAADLVAGPPEAFPECVPVLAEADDEVHLCHGVLVEKDKLFYVRGARGDSMFVKEATKLIFGRENLHGRSSSWQQQVPTSHRCLILDAFNEYLWRHPREASPGKRTARVNLLHRDRTSRRSYDATGRRHRKMTTPTADLQVSIDGHDVTAHVDTGADYSVISRRLATQLKKVTTESNGPLIRTAGGHLVPPSGRCTSRVSIRGHTYLTTFVILEQCSRDLILGMDFLTDNGALIDLPSKSVSFSTDHALPSDNKSEHRSTLRLLEEHVTLPPYSSRLIAVGTDSSDDIEGVAEGNRSLFLDRGISVARGIVQLHKGQAHVLLTNFSPEFQHLNTGTALAFLESITEASSALNIVASTPKVPSPENTDTSFDINTTLPKRQQDELRH
ncbi:uncharacterized protein ISCGN_011505 [Ixodes scapularis]